MASTRWGPGRRWGSGPGEAPRRGGGARRRPWRGRDAARGGPWRDPSPTPGGAGVSRSGRRWRTGGQKGPLLGVLLCGLLRRGFGVRDGLPISGGRRGARQRHPGRRGESPAIARRRRRDPFPVAHSSMSGLGFGRRRPLAASAAAAPSGLLLPGARVSGGGRLIPWPVAPSSRAQAQDWRRLNWDQQRSKLILMNFKRPNRW